MKYFHSFFSEFTDCSAKGKYGYSCKNKFLDFSCSIGVEYFSTFSFSKKCCLKKISLLHTGVDDSWFENYLPFFWNLQVLNCFVNCGSLQKALKHRIITYQIWLNYIYRYARQWFQFSEVSISLTKDSLPQKAKNGLPNLDFHKFFWSKRLIHSEKHMKWYFYIKFDENRWNHFWDIHLRSHFRFVVPHFRIFDLLQNLEIFFIHMSGTVYKIWCFYLY